MHTVYFGESLQSKSQTIRFFIFSINLKTLSTWSGDLMAFSNLALGTFDEFVSKPGVSSPLVRFV